MPWSQSRIEEERRQPVLNAPPVATLLAASLPILYVFQSRLPDQGLWLAFRPASLWDGQWQPGLFAAMFMHGSWAHVAMNAIGLLAFGAPVARLLGPGRGVAAFLLFYMACGLAASIGYALVHAASQDPLVGASGAVFGLMGAAMRLLGRRKPGLASLTNRRVLVNSGVLMGLNLATGLIGLAPGAEGARIAWEAHAVGFVVGILLIGPVFRWIGRERFDSSADLSDPRG